MESFPLQAVKLLDMHVCIYIYMYVILYYIKNIILYVYIKYILYYIHKILYTLDIIYIILYILL